MMIRPLVLIVGLVLLAPGFSQNASAQGETETTIVVRSVPAPIPEVADSVAATLTTVDGSPVGGARIEFRVQVDLLGARTAYLGESMTGATGEARVPFTPRSSTQVIEARFAGDQTAGLAATVGTGPVSFPESHVEQILVERPESQLSLLRSVVPRVLGIVVAGLWLFFMFVAVSLARDIRRGSRGGETATP